MIDNGSTIDIWYSSVFVRIGLKDGDLKSATTPLYGYIGDFIMLRGRIILPFTVGEYPKTMTVMAEFLVVDCPSTFNTLLGRLSLKALKVATLIYHLVMKFATPEGVGMVKGSQHYARKCYNATIKIVNKAKQPLPQTMMVVKLNDPPDSSLDLRKPQDKPKIGPVEGLIDLIVDS